MKRNYWFIGLLSLFFSIHVTLGATTDLVTCAVCGMDTKDHSKIGFEATFEGKPVHFCSLSCAIRFHAKHQDVHIFGHDFETAESIDTKESFFLVKSTKVLKEIEFGMPPSVVIFSSNKTANRTQARLDDGKVVKGFDQAAKEYR